MKKLITLLLTGTLLSGSASLAQETTVEATFYNGIPSDSGSMLTNDFRQNATATLVSHAISESIYNLEGTES